MADNNEALNELDIVFGYTEYVLKEVSEVLNEARSEESPTNPGRLSSAKHRAETVAYVLESGSKELANIAGYLRLIAPERDYNETHPPSVIGGKRPWDISPRDLDDEKSKAAFHKHKFDGIRTPGEG